MAKLGAFYSLCPLVEHRTLLDISQDKDEGIVIVTLGRNIAGRYKISDQRQITCWRTKEKFSSPVLYDDKSTNYVAVFNHSHIKFWDIDDNLDKLKKFKFNKPIYTIIKNNDDIYVIFQNGNINTLEYSLEDRKMSVNTGLELKQIDDVLHADFNENIYFGIISNNVLYWTRFEKEQCKFSKIILAKTDLILRGYIFHIIRNNLYLITLWSDGSMYSRLLQDENLGEDNLGEIMTVVDSVSSKHAVSMKSLDENYIALYGANVHEEGALLVLYNIQFKVTQSRQPFKLFTNNGRIWRIDNNLYLPVGQNLAVIPFHLETEQLAALVGSHKLTQTNNKNDDVKIVHDLEIVSWDGKALRTPTLPPTLKDKIDQYNKQGLTESAILEALLPDIFKTNNLDLLKEILHNFSDISEKYLVSILSYALNNTKLNLLPIVLARSFSEVLILPYLRSELSLDKVIDLLKYIHKCWIKNIIFLKLTETETQAKLLDWTCATLDANYQKIVLSKNDSLVKLVTNLKSIVNTHLESLDEIKKILPILHNISKGRALDKCFKFNESRYSIEQISLY